MNHPWQQPIRPLEVLVPRTANCWATVLFIRPKTDRGWEVITMVGSRWSSDETEVRYPQDIE